MIQHVPLLASIRPLYDLPREASLRFPRYLALLGSAATTVIPPLNVMNPMAKPHVSTYLDQLISADIDTLASTWITEVEAQIGDLGEYRHGFGVADDIAGGWTERSATEMRQRFTPPYQHWLTTVLFASDTISISHIRGLLRATCYRHYYQRKHGVSYDIASMLQQEQDALRFGNIVPLLSPDELIYTDHIIKPYLAATDYPTQIAVLWGDDVARHNGFPPLGFSPEAGFAWAGHFFHQKPD